MVEVLKEILPVPLTDQEVAELGRSLAHELETLDKVTKDKTEITKAAKEEIERQQGVVNVLAKTLRDGTRETEVEVEESADYELGKWQTRRLDTGEVIDEREMTDEERLQRELPLVAVDADDPELPA